MADAKTTLRLAPELNDRLRAVADREHRSVHAQVLVYIERGLLGDEAAHRSLARYQVHPGDSGTEGGSGAGPE